MEEVKRTRALINATASEKLSANQTRAFETLKSHNQRLLDELKQISSTIDFAIENMKPSHKQVGEEAKQSELKSIVTQEANLQKDLEYLRSQLEGRQKLDPVDLNRKNAKLVERIKQAQINIRETERKVHDQSRELEHINTNPDEVQHYKIAMEELRVIKEKCKQLSQQDEKRQAQINATNQQWAELEQQAVKLGVDLPRNPNEPKKMPADFEPQVAPADSSDVRGVNSQIEEAKKSSQQAEKKNAQKIRQLNVQLEEAYQQKQELSKRLKELEQIGRVREHTIKQLKRQIRSNQMRASGPDLNIAEVSETGSVPKTTSSNKISGKPHKILPRGKLSTQNLAATSPKAPTKAPASTKASIPSQPQLKPTKIGAARQSNNLYQQNDESYKQERNPVEDI